MDLEKQDKPLFKIDEKRLEKFLEEMPEDMKNELRNRNKSDALFAIIFMLAAFCSERSECDDKEKNHNETF